MQITLRKLAPALLIATLALAGCQTPGHKTGQAEGTQPSTSGASTPPGTPSTTPGAPSAGQVTVPKVGFLLAQNNPGPGLTEVKLSDGSIYVQRQPVLTRADLTEAAPLASRQGENYVGLRFTEGGARTLNTVTTQNVGKLLVLVADGNILAALRISEPLTRGVLAFSVNSAQTAQDIVAKVRGDQPAAAGTPGATPASTAPRQQ
ncbi:SecDF P1 head subdomain-containing protein [Achromobacter aloeverae]|uniref:Preprotein translocase subunit SecD n=1 Tax=Achromobacter aloeverae TaxID=1750518 RepID=A0A4Q1HEA4_9BURK|nr:preprotein translocase subunit SecD [Achromobacter aloeverae]RXN84646.1 preprotein translocase subunit SecD [Achromobacter aloeverae]